MAGGAGTELTPGWATQQNWTLHDAALHGSSHYDLPPVLQWMSANIGIHQVHHLCSRIRFYRLPSVMEDHSKLASTSKLRCEPTANGK